MPITLDQNPVDLGPMPTLGNALDALTKHLAGSGKIIINVAVDGQPLDGQALTAGSLMDINDRHVAVATADRDAMARQMIGKLAALVDYLATQHRAIATLIEQAQTPKALNQLTSTLSAWQQIHASFSSLTQMLQIDLDRFQINEIPARDLLLEFQGQLKEIQTALENRDMVLLADVLQYELDRAIEIWQTLLASVLGVVDGVLTPAGTPAGSAS